MANILKETGEVLTGVVARWCPDSFNHKPFENRMMRALLKLAAFEQDYEAVKKGEAPIRTDYPLQLV